MANAISQVQASKFFTAPEREILVFSEEDFGTLAEFKEAIADQVRTVYTQGAELRFQHKGFLRGQQWSIDINMLSMYCDKQQCRLVQYGTKDNNYTWRIVPRVKLSDTTALF